MTLNSNGIVTARDSLTIADSKAEIQTRVKEFANGQPEVMRAKFALGKDVRDWKVEWAQADVAIPKHHRFRSIAYRPFSTAWTYYTGHSRGFHCYPRDNIMRNYIDHENIGLLTTKSSKDRNFAHAFVTDTISEAIFLSGTTASNAMNLPLYIYPEVDALEPDAFAAKNRTFNLAPNLYGLICVAAGIDPADQARPDDDFRASTGDARPSEVKVFDYIYGVLHAPNYRETFAEFLKIDFPRIPYPTSPEVFRAISEKGEQLRRLHLMEHAAIGDTPYPYHGDGDDVVAAGYPKHEDGKVHINADQYFDAVPPVAWTFHIGGYQPAQKWLKDRRGRVLSYDDIGHYQKIVKILAETDRIMKEIELPLS